MRVLFACGGTAGHINPAIAVADRLRSLDPDCEVLFVGTPDRMETELVPKAGYEIRTVNVTNFSRRLNAEGIRHNIRSVRNALSSTRASKKMC